jgi:hypothetical protein
MNAGCQRRESNPQSTYGTRLPSGRVCLSATLAAIAIHSPGVRRGVLFSRLARLLAKKRGFYAWPMIFYQAASGQADERD